MEQDHKKQVQERILANESFVRAVFSGQQKGSSLKWVKVVVRPVEIKGVRNLQFSYFDAKKDITSNYPLEECAARVDDLLALPFRNIFVETSIGSLQVNISKKGKALVNEVKAASPSIPDLSHDRQKSRLLTAENAGPFLKAVGIMTNDGVLSRTHRKLFTGSDQLIHCPERADGDLTAVGDQELAHGHEV